MKARTRAWVAVLAGVVAVVVVLAIGAAGWLVGPGALLAGALAWVFVPTSRRLSSRIAINGAVVLGFSPILFWGPAVRVGNIGVVELLLALAMGLLAVMLVLGPATRRRLLPRVDASWWIPVATALFAAWYFWPFLRTRSNSASLAMLIQAFGGDNVAHFDMFAMIRSHGTGWLGWGAPTDGSTFAYTTYPQHFHALAAMGADLWAGVPTMGENRAGLYVFGTALVLGVALITLAAAIASNRLLAGIPGLPAISVAAAISVLFLGAGVTNLSFGFPGFVLALLGSLIAIVIASSRRRPNAGELAAVGGMLILVAHCWILLAPLAGIPFVLMAFRLPWRAMRARRAGLFLPLGICLIVVASSIYAVVIVLAATSSAGSPQAALGTPGGVAPLPIPVGVSLALAIVALCCAAVGMSMDRRPLLRRSLFWRSRRSPYVLIGLVAAVALLEASGLTAIQLIRAHFISYFQYKLFNGLILVFAVLLAFCVSVWIAEMASRRVIAVRKAAAATAVALLCAALVVLSGFPTGGKQSLAGQAFASDAFRSSLDAAADNPAPGVERLALASALMETGPCVSPFYLAAASGDFGRGESSQWAMSLSGSWTMRGSEVSNYYFAHDVAQATDPSTELRVLLRQDNERCAIVAPSVRSSLDAGLLDRYGDRILTWRG
jgi:hypothetical protein